MGFFDAVRGSIPVGGDTHTVTRHQLPSLGGASSGGIWNPETLATQRKGSQALDRNGNVIGHYDANNKLVLDYGGMIKPAPSGGDTGMGWMGPPDPPYPGAAVPQVQVWHPGPPPPNYTGPMVPKPNYPGVPLGGEPVRVGPSAQPADPNNPNAQPAGGGGMGQDPEAYFNSLFPGDTLSPEQLVAREAELKAVGIRILGPNAAGQRSKIQLPNGQVYDVIGGAGSGQNRKQFMAAGGGGGAGSIGAMGGGYNDGKSPSDILKATPGFQFRFDEGLDALQRSAAAKGVLLTGGTLKDIVNYGQNFASGEFQNQWMRDMDLARMGAGAAGALGDFGSAYGSNMINAANNYGTAGAAGSAAQGNIWGKVAGQVGGVLSKKPWEKPANPYSPTASGGGNFSPYSPPSLGQAGPN